jgi:DNA topoisomerase-1
MAANLFIIEAPGKRQGLFEVLRRASVRDIEIEATVGHLCANPDGFKPLAVDGEFRETAYRIRADKERLAASIAAKASEARRIYLASDDDQEGDVIARDVLRFCIPEEHRHKAVRLRLKSLAQAEVQAALRDAQPFDDLMAAQGDARRVIDRLLGALSDESGAIGRVQGSLLVAMAEQRPVVGVVTHTLAAVDGKGAFLAKSPVFAGQRAPEPMALSKGVAVASAERTTISAGPMNHDQILLAASLRTGAVIEDVSRSMQKLYERGRMSYPRAKDCAISRESLKRLSMVARANGAAFRADLFEGVRDVAGAHAHEAPNPLVLDVPVNRNFDLLTLDEQVLVTITRNLIEAGIEARLERPNALSLPLEARDLNWHRINPIGTRLWQAEKSVAGMHRWTKEQSLLHFMTKQQLGRPSTIVSHVNKFLTRGLVTQDFDFTKKGREWHANTGDKIGYRNLSVLIEDFIEKNRKLPSEMVADMIELFELHTVKYAVEQQMEHIDHEDNEISSGFVP